MISRCLCNLLPFECSLSFKCVCVCVSVYVIMISNIMYLKEVKFLPLNLNTHEVPMNIASIFNSFFEICIVHSNVINWNQFYSWRIRFGEWQGIWYNEWETLRFAGGVREWEIENTFSVHFGRKNRSRKNVGRRRWCYFELYTTSWSTLSHSLPTYKSDRPTHVRCFKNLNIEINVLRSRSPPNPNRNGMNHRIRLHLIYSRFWLLFMKRSVFL